MREGAGNSFLVEWGGSSNFYSKNDIVGYRFTKAGTIIMFTLFNYQK